MRGHNIVADGWDHPYPNPTPTHKHSKKVSKALVFPLCNSITTDQRTDGPMDQQNDGWTKPLMHHMEKLRFSKKSFHLKQWINSWFFFVRTSNASSQVITADGVNVELLVASANGAFQHFFGWVQRFDIWKITWMNEWMDEWMNEWMNEWVKEWKSEWTNSTV